MLLHVSLLITSSPKGWVIKMGDMLFFYKDPLHQEEKLLNSILKNGTYYITHSFTYQNKVYHAIKQSLCISL